MAVLALAASGYLVFHSEKQLASRRATLRSFDAGVRDALSSLADLRAGEQAYVAAGQGVAFWMPKVAALTLASEQSVDALRATATDADAQSALMQAAAAISEFKGIDTRARDYLKSSQPLMAADVVFTEGGETAAATARHVDAASVAEHLGYDRFEAAQKKAELYAVAAGAGVAVLMLMLLAGTGAGAEAIDEDASLGFGGESIARRTTEQPPVAPAPRDFVPALKVAATLCTDFGRVRDLDDIRSLLGRAADALDASGLIVWLGSTAGGHLRPIVAHGYPPQLLERMPPIPKSADNAAAAAYRTGALQIVLSRPGGVPGALVAPLISPDGCIGSLTAEIKGGAESSDQVQALAVLFAAQLAGVLAGSAQADVAEAPPRAANL